MTETLIVDASIAIKWVVQETGTKNAIALRKEFRFAAPDLFVCECANILWKKTQRAELSKDEAKLAARLLERSGVELHSTLPLMGEATELAIDLGHPAYDCFYACLAVRRNCRFVTADERLLTALRQSASPALSSLCVTMEEIVASRS
ncbi:type II toxin-antitoxin system VapC family toxin [Rhizobium sp. RAF56]|uniref:type II toxin-antitoxin system VapC family toxin n=1 Tax=Rhizobium sp. RAF56 TaxID=3233062 RepID=UPI003F9682AB